MAPNQGFQFSLDSRDSGSSSGPRALGLTTASCPCWPLGPMTSLTFSYPCSHLCPIITASSFKPSGMTSFLPGPWQINLCCSGLFSESWSTMPWALDGGELLPFFRQVQSPVPGPEFRLFQPGSSLNHLESLEKDTFPNATIKPSWGRVL